MYIDTFSEIQFLKTQFSRNLSMLFDENNQIEFCENIKKNLSKIHASRKSFARRLFMKLEINLPFSIKIGRKITQIREELKKL